LSFSSGEQRFGFSDDSIFRKEKLPTEGGAKYKLKIKNNMGHPALDIPPREKGQARPPIFVHSLIDDLDLTLEAFRIYAHLARRWGDGTHDSVGSYRKLGEHCFRASFPCASPATLKRKAIAAIQELEENGLIEKHKHQGNDGRDISNSYTLRTSEEIKAFQGTSHPNVIPFPYPSETIHPPVQYHCFKEGTTTKGSNTKTPLSASTSVEENFFTEVAVTETQKTSPHQPLSLVRNESEQTECSAKVEEKVKPRLDGQCLSKSPIGKAPFQSLEEMNAFQLALTEFARATGKRSPCGFAQSILNQMRSTGYEHPYWQEWKQGRAIGTHETQEWEAQPGQPYPYFLNWLAEQLKRNQDSEAQALQQANWICSNPQHAKSHWEKFKLKLQREAEEKNRSAQQNIAYVAPQWARQQSVSFDQAVTAVHQIQGFQPKSTPLQPSQTNQDSQADEWINPVESVENWLADIETKWNGISRGISQRFFCSALFHASPQEQAQIYKLLLNNPFTKDWAKTLIAQEMNYDF
jgi:hypothetical protein